MSQPSSIRISESAAGSGTHRRGWFFTCFYWTAQGIYGLFAAILCCFAFSLVVSIYLPVLTPLAAHLATAGVDVISILIGIQAAYRNHRWVQRRETAKRNA